MIPKIIHYCWFGRGEKPELAKKCIASWKKFCPDFEICEWNEDNCDYLAMPFMAEAYAAKKYAFVSDVMRLVVLEQYGACISIPTWRCCGTFHRCWMTMDSLDLRTISMLPPA